MFERNSDARVVAELRLIREELRGLKSLLFRMQVFHVKVTTISERIDPMTKVKEFRVQLEWDRVGETEDVDRHAVRLSTKASAESDPVALEEVILPRDATAADWWLREGDHVTGSYRRIDAAGNEAITPVDFTVEDTIAPTAAAVRVSAVEERVVDVPDPEPAPEPTPEPADGA